MTTDNKPLKEKMTIQEQLERWVKGESVHNESRDECCPDFSCCKPKLLAPENERIAFFHADEKLREDMLHSFLGRLLKSEFGGQNVHVIR